MSAAPAMPLFVVPLAHTVHSELAALKLPHQRAVPVSCVRVAGAAEEGNVAGLNASFEGSARTETASLNPASATANARTSRSKRTDCCCAEREKPRTVAVVSDSTSITPSAIGNAIPSSRNTARQPTTSLSDDHGET